MSFQSLFIKKGALAVCSKGALGLLTSAEPQEITYKRCDYCIGAISGADGPCTCEKGTAYVGIHLTDKIAPIGSPWSSRNPAIIGEIDHNSVLIREASSARNYQHANRNKQ